MIVDKTGFIYLWFDTKRKMYYIGCHIGKEDDGYICSSKWMRDAYRYRKHDFKRRILKRNILLDDLLNEEYKWLSLISDDELGKKYYNLNKHHFGHWCIDSTSRKTVKQKLSEASKKLHQTPEYREKYIEGRKKMPPQTQEQIDKRAIANTGKKRTEETKRKISESNKGKVLGPLSDEHRRKVSESLKGEKNPFFGKQHDPELKKKMNAKTSATMKGRPPNNAKMIKGTFWWNNGTINKRSKDCPGNGWNRGTVKKRNLVP
jgi:hypothetical protein